MIKLNCGSDIMNKFLEAIKNQNYYENFITRSVKNSNAIEGNTLSYAETYSILFVDESLPLQNVNPREETKEETNVDIEICNKKRYSLSYIQNKNINKEVVYFLAKPKGDFKISIQENEIQDAFWVDIEKVREILTYENLRQLWDIVLND